jgi:hypothetical protein
MKPEVERPGSWATALFDAIARVVGVRAQLQVRRIAARWIVANGVHHDHPLGDRSVRHFPGHPMGGSFAGPYAHAAITRGIATTGPQVTTRPLVDLQVGVQPLGD